MYKNITYRFFCAFLSVALLAGSILPTGLHGKTLAKKVTDIFSGNHTVTVVKTECYFSSKCIANDEQKKAVQTDKDTLCNTTIVCNCCINDVPVIPEAASISQVNQFKNFSLPVKNIGQTVPILPLPSFIDYKFLKTSDSSPPIFLLNSVFLN